MRTERDEKGIVTYLTAEEMIAWIQAMRACGAEPIFEDDECEDEPRPNEWMYFDAGMSPDEPINLSD